MLSRLVLWACLLAASAGAETIPIWRTPEGRLHLGDRPPEGSALVEVAAFPDAPSPTGSPQGEDALARAAADGREIIRRRAEERRAERARAAEAETREEEPRSREPLWIVVTTLHALPPPTRLGCDVPFFPSTRRVSDAPVRPSRAVLGFGPRPSIARASPRPALGARLW
jgi:hypothetical protein